MMTSLCQVTYLLRFMNISFTIQYTPEHNLSVLDQASLVCYLLLRYGESFLNKGYSFVVVLEFDTLIGRNQCVSNRVLSLLEWLLRKPCLMTN